MAYLISFLFVIVFHFMSFLSDVFFLVCGLPLTEQEHHDLGEAAISIVLDRLFARDSRLGSWDGEAIAAHRKNHCDTREAASFCSIVIVIAFCLVRSVCWSVVGLHLVLHARVCCLDM